MEILNRRRTGREFHSFVNPERDIEAGAFDVHGIRLADLADKPRFGEIAHELLEFVRDGEVIIHNAPFDEGFVDAELARLGGDWGRLRDHCRILDTLELARRMHPGQKNSLDALCGRYQIDNSQRDLHGALLDARILTDVYLAMTGGQTHLQLEDSATQASTEAGENQHAVTRGAPLKTIPPTGRELAAHHERLQGLDRISGGRCLWRKYEGG